MSQKPPPPWLAQEVSNGLQALLTLGLKWPPAADVVGKTLDIWVNVIWQRIGGADERLAAPRIRAAFERLFTRREWPTPADFLDALPAPAPLPVLPRPKMTEAERAANRARWAAITEKFFQTKRMR